MFRLTHMTALALSASLALMLPGTVEAQRRDGRSRPTQPRVAAPRSPERPHPNHVAPLPSLRGQVFIGGYFYDPFFGPYPWWTRGTYPYWYTPVFDLRADVRLKVSPKEANDAAVYVDGFYAGVVDDFDGVFQSLPLPPGGHTIVLYLDGYRTVRRHLYLARGSSFTVHENMVRLMPGEVSEPPDMAPTLPTPPAGSYRLPGRVPSAPTQSTRPAATDDRTASLDLFVQPDTADVTIDGERWMSSEAGHFVLQLPAGQHRIDVHRQGYRTFTQDIELREGDVMPLNISLTPMTT